MTIIERYLAREITRIFGAVLLGIIGIYIIVEFFERLEKFMKAGVPLDRIAQYFLFRIPFMVSEVVPIAVLLAVIITLGLMQRNNEILALRATGVSIYYLVRPILTMGVLFTLFHLILLELIVPATMDKANRMWIVEVRKKYSVKAAESDVWIRGDRHISNINHYDPLTQTVEGVTHNVFDDDFRLIKRIDAESGVFQREQWHLQGVLVQTYDPQTQGYHTRFEPELAMELDFLPDDLKRLVRKTNEMGFRQLRHYIKQLASEGYATTQYRVDMFAKTARPFACIITCLLGMGIAVNRRLKEGLASGVAVGFAMVFVYWILYGFCLSLGYGGILPPLVAAWFANLLFLGLAALIMLQTD
ncbi:MAG: LPS export ABC transporter permease LptG [Desulfobacterales bacterium]|jgi:lipopolysaccharide export system permease protein